MRNITKKGMAKGLAKGMAEGMAKGKTEGKAEGEAQRTSEIARKMKALGLSIDVIRQATGLDTSEIERLN